MQGNITKIKALKKLWLFRISPGTPVRFLFLTLKAKMKIYLN